MTQKSRSERSYTADISSFETTRYAHLLQEALVAATHDVRWEADVSLARVVTRGFRHSPIDHWENNGILEDLDEWSQPHHSPMLWIGGRSGNQDTWVTELSADMVQTLLPESPSVLYIFCDDISSNLSPLTPVSLLINLISQILTLHPHIAYQNPGWYSPRRFQQAKSFDQVWAIFKELVRSIEEVFLVIDRIEECISTDEVSLTRDFLPAVIGLLQEAPGSKAIVTSESNPPEQLFGFLDHGLENVYIEKSRHRRLEF